MKSMRKEDPVPYPARPPLQLLENPENTVLREANPNNVFCRLWWVSFTVRTLDLHESPPFQLQIWPQVTLTNILATS